MEMLQNNFIPQLYATRLPMETQWFMQDVTHSHTANIVLDFLHDHFGDRVVSNRLDPYDCFLWGHSKEKIYRNRPRNLIQLRADIITYFQGITEDLCRRLVRNFTVRLEEVARQRSGHTEHALLIH